MALGSHQKRDFPIKNPYIRLAKRTNLESIVTNVTIPSVLTWHTNGDNSLDAARDNN